MEMSFDPIDSFLQPRLQYTSDLKKSEKVGKTVALLIALALCNPREITIRALSRSVMYL